MYGPMSSNRCLTSSADVNDGEQERVSSTDDRGHRGAEHRVPGRLLNA